MKTTVTITVEGCEDCHPSDDEMETMARVLRWILVGKMCGDQIVTIDWSPTE